MWWTWDFLSLIYPRICVCCGNTLWQHEEIICNLCKYHLPKTHFHLEDENPVSKLFWGRAPVYSGAACFYFNKGSKVQQLIHHLKYKGRKDIGVSLGIEYGYQLKKSPFFSPVNRIIPVPLHKQKFMKRGYNQSEQFAIGLCQSMNVMLDNRKLIRIKATGTQTKKSRYNRWENVSQVFAITYPEQLENMHVLLVDDVITTGATLESCISVLSDIHGIKISVAVIAMASV